jgi:hypothetical protein
MPSPPSEPSYNITAPYRAQGESSFKAQFGTIIVRAPKLSARRMKPMACKSTKAFLDLLVLLWHTVVQRFHHLAGKALGGRREGSIRLLDERHLAGEPWIVHRAQFRVLSARTSIADPGRMATPNPARTIPTAVDMYVASAAMIGNRPSARNAASTIARTLLAGCIRMSGRRTSAATSIAPRRRSRTTIEAELCAASGAGINHRKRAYPGGAWRRVVISPSLSPRNDVPLSWHCA